MSSYVSISSDHLQTHRHRECADDHRCPHRRGFRGRSALHSGSGADLAHPEVQDWASQLTGQSVVVVCQKGQKLSEGTPPGCATPAWRPKSSKAGTLAGGKLICRRSRPGKIPARDGRGRTVWVTRSRPKIDRIACPWLIRRFIDPSAVFLFVAAAEVQAVSERFNATPFDVNVFWSHRGELCTFDVMVWRNSGSRPHRCNDWRQWCVPPIPGNSIFRRRRPVYSLRPLGFRECTTTTSSS